MSIGTGTTGDGDLSGDARAPRESLIGRVLGQHIVLERIGGGTFGEVYRARHRLLGRERAIKVLREQHASDDRLSQLFIREAQLAAGLDHPNVVVVHDVGDEQDIPYIIMELLRGTSLRKMLQSSSPVPFEYAIPVLAQLAAALDFGHAEGVVHRDVKPENAMIDAAGRLKLVDFGIGRAREASDETVFGAGTAPYMAPELILATREGTDRPFEIGMTADRYALGIVAYEIVTGSAPFGGLRGEIERAHLRTEPPPPHTLRDDIPLELEIVLLRQLAKEPDARYASCTEFVAALQEALVQAVERTATPALPGVGSQLGAYRLVEQTGRSGRGVTFRGVHRLAEHISRDIVVMPSRLHDRPSFSRDLATIAETAILAMSLSHPNLVRVLDIADQGDVVYAIQERVEGITLQQLLRDAGRLEPGRAATLVLQLARALDYMHRQEVIHRDVKPSNVLVGADDHISLTNFAIVTSLVPFADREKASLIGTPLYMAPEVIKGGHPMVESDGWALGIVAYELLTGAPPFKGLRPIEILRAAVKEQPAPPSSVEPTLSPDVDAVILQQLSKEPAERHRTAVEFAQRLEAAIKHMGSSAQREPDDPPVPQASGSQPTAPQPPASQQPQAPQSAPAQSTTPQSPAPPPPASAPQPPALQPTAPEVAFGTSAGVVRHVNQDAVTVEHLGTLHDADRQILAAVADGYGQAGEEASALAVHVTRDRYVHAQRAGMVASGTQDVLGVAVAEAAKTVLALYGDRGSGSRPAASKSGTTLTVVVLGGQQIQVAHVGNSRLYLIVQRQIELLTRDHIWTANALQTGQLTPAEARVHPHRKLLTRALGAYAGVEPDLSERTVEPGSVLVLCTDGLTEHVRDDEILAIAGAERPQVAVDRLMRLAAERGGSDNVTVVVLRV